MGQVMEAVCKACQHRFRTVEGGGFHFELLRCRVCGESKAVPFKAVWDSYLAYLKGRKPLMPEPNGADWRKYPGKPISEADYHRAVETEAGTCSCGGKFSLNAPLRCPACRSADVESGKPTVLFD